VTILKILTYALVSTWSSVSSGYEHVTQLMQPCLPKPLSGPLEAKCRTSKLEIDRSFVRTVDEVEDNVEVNGDGREGEDGWLGNLGDCWKLKLHTLSLAELEMNLEEIFMKVVKLWSYEVMKLHSEKRKYTSAVSSVYFPPRATSTQVPLGVLERSQRCTWLGLGVLERSRPSKQPQQ